MPNPYAARNLFSYGYPPSSGFGITPSSTSNPFVSSPVHPLARKHGRIAVWRVAPGLTPLSLPRALARLSCIGTCRHDFGALSNSSIQRRYCRALALLQGIGVIAGHHPKTSQRPTHTRCLSRCTMLAFPLSVCVSFSPWLASWLSPKTHETHVVKHKQFTLLSNTKGTLSHVARYVTCCYSVRQVAKCVTCCYSVWHVAMCLTCCYRLSRDPCAPLSLFPLSSSKVGLTGQTSLGKTVLDCKTRFARRNKACVVRKLILSWWFLVHKSLARLLQVLARLAKTSLGKTGTTGLGMTGCLAWYVHDSLARFGKIVARYDI